MSIATEIVTLRNDVAAKSVKGFAIVSIAIMSVFTVNITEAAGASPMVGFGVNTIADMVEENLDAVVNISAVRLVEGGRTIRIPDLPKGSPFEDLFKKYLKDQKNGNGDKNNDRPKRRVGSLGSGFVISADGYVVTNNHVIADAEEITVIFTNGEELIAKVIGFDKKTDIALLKVEAVDPLKFVEFGDNSKLRIGTWVVTIGNPFGLGVSVSAGIVSATNRNINSGPYDDFIQTDAGINKGNSGGPLFNLDGKVVGVNTALISPTGGSVGVGFSVPASTVVPVIEQLKKYGKTRRGWLGVMIQSVTDDIAESLGMDVATGAFVAKIFEGSPAEAAGVKPQDVIIRFNNKLVETQSALPKIVADTQIDKKVVMIVIRDGKEIELNVVVGLLKENNDRIVPEEKTEEFLPEGQKILGMQLQEINETIIDEFKLDEDTKGLMIIGVDENSEAALKGLRLGDRILEAAQSEVNSYIDLKAKIKQMKKKGRKSILLLVEQLNGSIRFVALSIK